MNKLLLSLLIFLSFGFSKEITFSKFETIIEKGNSSIDFTNSNYCISPGFADWDNDGITDLLTGYWATSDTINWLKDARIRFYKNYGTNDAPSYESWAHIQAEGIDIQDDAG